MVRSRSDEQLVSRREPAAPPTPPMFMALTAYASTDTISGRAVCANAALCFEKEIRDHRLALPVHRLAANGLEEWAAVERRGFEGLISEENAPYPCSTPWLTSKLSQDRLFVMGGLPASLRQRPDRLVTRPRCQCGSPRSLELGRWGRGTHSEAMWKPAV